MKYRLFETFVIVAAVAVGWGIAILLFEGTPALVAAGIWTFVPVIPLSIYFQRLEKRRVTLGNKSNNREV